MPYILKSNDSIVEIRETGALKIPTGTTSQRPTVSEAGYIRYNTSVGNIEYFDGVKWKSTFSYEYTVINFLQDTSTVSLPVTVILSAAAGAISLTLGNNFKDGNMIVISNKSSQTIIVSANYPFDGVISTFSLSSNTTARFIFSSARTTWFVL